MNDVGFTFEQLKERLGSTTTHEQLLAAARSLKVATPLNERIYEKQHKVSGDETPTAFIVVPNPTANDSRRDLWVRKSEFPKLLAHLNNFARENGLAE